MPDLKEESSKKEITQGWVSDSLNPVYDIIQLIGPWEIWMKFSNYF